MMNYEDLKDSNILQSLIFFERRYTAARLKKVTPYKNLLREAIRRGLRLENLSEQEQLARVEMEGPGFDRVS